MTPIEYEIMSWLIVIVGIGSFAGALAMLTLAGILHWLTLRRVKKSAGRWYASRRTYRQHPGLSSSSRPRNSFDSKALSLAFDRVPGLLFAISLSLFIYFALFVLTLYSFWPFRAGLEWESFGLLTFMPFFLVLLGLLASTVWHRFSSTRLAVQRSASRLIGSTIRFDGKGSSLTQSNLVRSGYQFLASCRRFGMPAEEKRLTSIMTSLQDEQRKALEPAVLRRQVYAILVDIYDGQFEAGRVATGFPRFLNRWASESAQKVTVRIALITAAIAFVPAIVSALRP